MKSKAKTLQKTIRWYAISTVILTGFVIALVVMLPLQARLFDMQKQHLVFSRDVRVLVLDACFDRLQEAAHQISSRMNGVKIMLDYDQHKINQSQVQNALTPVFQNSLDTHIGLVGITRLDKNHHTVAQIGLKIVSNEIITNMFDHQLDVYGPVPYQEKHYIIVMSPIQAANTVIGYDFFTFNFSIFQKIIDEKLRTKLGNAYIYYLDNNQVAWLQTEQSSVKKNPFLDADKEMQVRLTNSILQAKSGYFTEKLESEKYIAAFAPIKGAPWGILVVADKMDLYHAVQHVVAVLAIIVLLILLFFGLGLAAVLRPLSGQLLIENQELETLVESSQVELKKLNEKLFQMAMMDSLTGALTRRAFYHRVEEEIARCRRHRHSFTLLFMDIDRFKNINDTHGHDAGDFLLKAFANRITQIIRKEDVMARLGGDEFALLLPERNDRDFLVALIARIRSEIRKPVRYHDIDLDIEVSIGSAIFPNDGDQVDTLLKAADTKMYEDKTKNKDAE